MIMKLRIRPFVLLFIPLIVLLFATQASTVAGAVYSAEDSPVAEFSASPTSGALPLIVQFTNLSTGEFDECLWDFGDGRTATSCGNPSRRFGRAGSYTISLTVKGPGGEDTMIKTDYITVYGPPTADFSASPTSGAPPLTVEFTNLSTGEFDECTWDFGDGRTETTCDDLSIEYLTGGSYTVSLTAKGPGGEDTMIKTDYITVYDPPTADFSASPTSGAPPLRVEFTNLSTGEFDECLWDFGDGRTSTSCGDLSRRFGQEGSYTVSLTVKGPGGEDTSEMTIKVASPHLFLPVAVANYTGPYRYFDDFSDPNSGWHIGDYQYSKLGYLNGEYQLIVKAAPRGLLVTPNLTLPGDYQVEVDARQASDNNGSYGLMFGMNWGANSYEGYQFLVYPQDQLYLLEKRNMDGTWHLMIDWTYNDAIKPGKESNKLRVDRTGTEDIHLYINGILVDTYVDSSFTSSGRDAGLRVYSYDTAPVDVRFDNFGAHEVR